MFWTWRRCLPWALFLSSGGSGTWWFRSCKAHHWAIRSPSLRSREFPPGWYRRRWRSWSRWGFPNPPSPGSIQTWAGNYSWERWAPWSPPILSWGSGKRHTWVLCRWWLRIPEWVLWWTQQVHHLLSSSWLTPAVLARKAGRCARSAPLINSYRRPKTAGSRRGCDPWSLILCWKPHRCSPPGTWQLQPWALLHFRDVCPAKNCNPKSPAAHFQAHKRPIGRCSYAWSK